ncbi:MAG: MFS transporter [Candidatus Limnocylindria bacterium]
MAARIFGTAASYREVLRSPRYVPLWLAQLVSSFGDTLHYVALVVLVFQLSGQGLAVAGLVAAEIVPVLALGPLAGVVIDRFSRRGILIASDLVRAALALSRTRWRATTGGRRLERTPPRLPRLWRPDRRSLRDRAAVLARGGPCSSPPGRSGWCFWARSASRSRGSRSCPAALGACVCVVPPCSLRLTGADRGALLARSHRAFTFVAPRPRYRTPR